MKHQITNNIYLLLALGFIWSGGLIAGTIEVPAEYGSIQTAIENAFTGDTILVSPGTYEENIDFHGKRLIVGSLFLTSGDTSYISTTIIDGKGDSSVVSFENREPVGTQLTGFSIRNGLGTGDWPYVRGGGIHMGPSSEPLISYCYVFNNNCTGKSNRGAGIYTANANPTIKNCRIYNNTSFSGAGLTLGNGAKHLLVDSCLIYNNSGAEAILIGYSDNVTISRSVIYNNNVGIRSHSTNNTRIIHCDIVDNTGMGISHSGVSSTVRDTVYLINSIVFWNGDSNYVPEDSIFIARYSLMDKAANQKWFGEGCSDAGPGFADSSYQLSEQSPAINAGDPAYPADPDGTRADIGAFYAHQVTALAAGQQTRTRGFILGQNYPNPFNPTTVIRFLLKKRTRVSLSIYNTAGQKISVLVNGNLNPGNHTYNWDASHLSSGIYYYRLEGNGINQSRKMVLLR